MAVSKQADFGGVCRKQRLGNQPSLLGKSVGTISLLAAGVKELVGTGISRNCRFCGDTTDLNFFDFGETLHPKASESQWLRSVDSAKLLPALSEGVT